MMRLLSVVAFVVLGTASPAFAQNNCPLELMRPGPVGAAGTGHDADSYIYRAFTGITWSMRAAVRCGDWREYKFALRNAPEGMTIVAGPCRTFPCDAGTITWTNPTATAADVQLTVSDADESDSATWTIKVSACAPGPGGCCVIDAAKGSDSKGGGTPASPWQTLAKAHGGCGARSVMFMRGAPAVTSSYELDGIPSRKRHYSDSIDYRESSHPVIWIGWPGEQPTIDLGYTKSMRAALELSGRNIWLDNFRTVNPYTITFSLIRSDRYGAVIRRLVMRGAGPGIDGANSGFLTFQRSDGAPTFADHIANNDFGDINYGTGNSCVKLYSMHNAVIEDNTASKIHSRKAEPEGCFAVKDSIRQFTLRHNQCSEFPAEVPCVSGNMHATEGIVTSGEMHHNNAILPQGAAYVFNLNGMAGPIRHWNNTWQGSVTALNVDSSDGPFTFERDVMMNDGGSGGCPGRLSCVGVTDASRIVVRNTLAGRADGRRASTTTGALIEPYLTKEGPGSPLPKGHLLTPPPR